MLILPGLHNLLSDILSPPTLHTAVLSTPAGQLIAYASADEKRRKEDVRVIIGLGGEGWTELYEEGNGMIECDVSSLSTMVYLFLVVGYRRTSFFLPF